MQRQLVTVLTLVLIAVGVWFSSARRNQTPGVAVASPEQTINAMLDASRRGDIRAYLACFTDSLKPQLEATGRQMGESRFAQYLMESQAPVVGVATTKQSEPRPDLVRYEVEFVLRDKNVRQMVELKKDGDQWRIESMGQSVYAKPPIPYGTKVFNDATPAATNRAGS